MIQGLVRRGAGIFVCAEVSEGGGSGWGMSGVCCPFVCVCGGVADAASGSFAVGPSEAALLSTVDGSVRSGMTGGVASLEGAGAVAGCRSTYGFNCDR